MSIVLREMTRDAADGIPPERTGGVRVADDTRRSSPRRGAVRRRRGAVRPLLPPAPEDGLVVGEIGGASSMRRGRSRSATPWSSRSGTAGRRGRRGTRDEGARGLRSASHRGPHAAGAPRAAACSKGGLRMVREIDDADEDRNVVRVENGSWRSSFAARVEAPASSEDATSRASVRRDPANSGMP